MIGIVSKIAGSKSNVDAKGAGSVKTVMALAIVLTIVFLLFSRWYA